MKPDRKQPARAPGSPERHDKQQASQVPRQSQDWYVIADEGELTLRISNGLRVGEDRWGELTLNHPLSAHRWLEFSIDADGELWCRSSRKDIAVRCDGEILDEVMLGAGVPIVLPHNLLHISNHIRRSGSSSRQIDVGLMEALDHDEQSSYDDLVDTQADVTPIPEPQTIAQSETAPGITEKNAAQTGSNNNLPDQLATTRTSANDSVETYIPTLETVVVAPRPVASEEAGPAIERAVAKLKNRSQAFAGSSALSPADSTESALVPVDADGPFHTDEIRAALQQPINVGEPTQRTGARLGNQRSAPIYTPSVTSSIVTPTEDPRLRLIAGVAITVLLILGAALLVAITAVPDDQHGRSLATGNRAAQNNAKAPTPATRLPSAQPRQSTQTSSASRTKSLLQTASALLNNPADLQPDTLDFAIRSLNLVLAAQPQNLQAQQLLATAEQFRADRNKPSIAAPRNSPSNTAPVNNFGAPDSRSQAYTYSDPRLAKAAQLIAQGAILAPRESSAIALIMSVLAEDPRSPEAVRLLNRSASVLVAQADEEYQTLGVYAARNTLEEVLSFHPKHGPANQRWRSWVATDSPAYEEPKLIPEINSGPNSGLDLEIDSLTDREATLERNRQLGTEFSLEDTP